MLIQPNMSCLSSIMQRLFNKQDFNIRRLYKTRVIFDKTRVIFDKTRVIFVCYCIGCAQFLESNLIHVTFYCSSNITIMKKPYLSSGSTTAAGSVDEPILQVPVRCERGKAL